MYEFEEKSMDSLETKSFNTVFPTNDSSYDLGAIVSPRLLKSMYQSEDWIFILVDKIASKLAQIPWQVQKQSMKDGEEVLEPAFGHPVQRMLDDPNPLQSSYSFKYALITDHSVTGNALIFHASSKNWLVQVPTEIIEPHISGSGDLLGYRISGIDPNAFPVGSQMLLSARDTIHVKRPNSSSVFWGLSPLIPGANATLFNKYSNEYLLNFYKKGAQPGLVLEMMEETNEVQAKKLLQSLETAYTGRANQRRGLVLPKGVKASNIAHTIADQQITELIRNNRETLINIFGVPKHELSIAESGSLGSEEYKTALKNFWQGPLMSIGGMFEAALTQRLKAQLGPGYVIKLNYSSVPILQEDVKERADTATAMLSTMTYNEVRQRIWKLPPIPGGDVLKDLVKPANPFMPTFSAPPTQQLAIEQKSSEPSVQELNRKAFHEYAASDDGKWVNESRDRLEEESKKASEKLEALWIKLLEDQVVASVKVLKEHLGEKAEVPDKRSLRRKIDEAMDEVEDQWREGYVDNLSRQIELGYDTVLDVPFNEPYREGIEAIRARDAKGRREQLKARSIEAFDSISKTTTERIMHAIENGMKENMSVIDIAKEITGIGANAAGRALTIARTETLIANSIGQAAAMKDAATVIPDLVKVWINAGDDRVRGKDGGLYPDSKSDHDGLGFQVVEAGEDFQDPRSGEKLSYPRDTKASAGAVINCFPADTIMETAGIEKSYQRFYIGPMVTVKFKSGAKLSATPNHPVLTTEGWIAIGKLTKGQKLIKARSLGLLVSKDAKIENVKAKANQIFSSFTNSLSTKRIGRTVMDFHGDGTTHDVDVKHVNRMLSNGGHTVFDEKIINVDLKNSNFTSGFALGYGAQFKSIGRVGFSHGFVSTGNLLKPPFLRESRPLKSFRFTPIPLNNSNISKPSNNSNSGDVQFPANFSNRHILNEVHTDDVIDIDVSYFSDHVYNLETVSGWYLAQNFIVHNCRCTMLTVSREDLPKLGLQ